MASKREILLNLYEKHVRDTEEKAIVIDVTVFLCHLTNTVAKCVAAEAKVYVNTRVLKHLYDKKPAEEFMFLIANIHKITKYPDYIYKNKNPKRGDFCFCKRLKGHNYLCSVEIGEEGAYVVTAFRLRKDSYLKNYELLWSWKGGIPSS